MASVLAIFRKDLHRLRLQLLVFWLLLGVAAITEPRASYWREANVSIVAVLAALYVVAAVIQQDSLVGDNQYWLTRPFTGPQLAAAKALFIACFVCAPILLAESAALALLSIPPWQAAGSLFWRQIIVLGIIILPAAALATVTRNLAQFLLAFFLVDAAYAILAMTFVDVVFPTWSAPAWLIAFAGYLALAIAGVAFTWLQYAHRSTTAGRGVLAACVVVSFFVYGVHYDDSVSVTVRITHGPAATQTPKYPQLTDVYSIPIHIPSVPAKAEALAGKVRLTLGIAGVREADIRDFREGSARLVIPFRPEDGATAYTLHGDANILLYQRAFETSSPLDAGTLRIPSVGVCAPQKEESRNVIVCLSPWPRNGVAIDSEGSLTWIIPPGIVRVSMDITRPFQPVERFTGDPRATALHISDYNPLDNAVGPLPSVAVQGRPKLVVVRTLYEIRGEIDFPNVRLADYRIAQ